MKYTTGALVIVALLGVTNAVSLHNNHKAKAQFTDDLVKTLAEDMQKEIEAPTEAEAPAKEEKVAIKTEKKEAKKETKKETKKVEKKASKAAATKKATKKSEKADDEIPMDAAAIKAYSSVIADAAEDSEPQTPVVYHQVAVLDDEKPRKAANDVYNPDPMGSMIQNEISSIKDASIKAAKERDD